MHCVKNTHTWQHYFTQESTRVAEPYSIIAGETHGLMSRIICSWCYFMMLLSSWCYFLMMLLSQQKEKKWMLGVFRCKLSDFLNISDLNLNAMNFSVDWWGQLFGSPRKTAYFEDMTFCIQKGYLGKTRQTNQQSIALSVPFSSLLVYSKYAGYLIFLLRFKWT